MTDEESSHLDDVVRKYLQTSPAAFEAERNIILQGLVKAYNAVKGTNVCIEHSCERGERISRMYIREREREREKQNMAMRRFES